MSENDALRCCSPRPGTCTRFGAGLAQRLQPALPQPLDHPPGRGSRGDRAKGVGLLTENPEIADAVTAIDQRHRKVSEHHTGVVLALMGKDVCPPARQCSGKTRAIGELVGQQAPGPTDDTLTIGADLGAAAAGTLHSQGALLQGHPTCCNAEYPVPGRALCSLSSAPSAAQ